jgi:HSP20 family molecular chaperone IbpA
MKKRAKGIHDIVTPLYREKVWGKRRIINAGQSPLSSKSFPKRGNQFFEKRKGIATFPKVWSFSTEPKFRRYQRSIEKTLLIERVEDPKTDVLEKVDNLFVMAELPNVEKEEIQWEINGDIFSIFAQDRSRSSKYMKEILLPFVVDRDNIKTRFRNGIFEIFLCRHKGKKK